MAGAITDADRTFIEEWECIATQSYTVMKFDYQGATKHQLIQGRRKFTISTAERKITEERILDVKDNPFRNGDFRPIIVPDSVSIETNPNALSDEEITSILVSSEFAWQQWMDVIDSPSTLARMADLANNVEGLTLSRFKEIERRLLDSRPKTQVTNKDRDAFEKLGATR